MLRGNTMIALAGGAPSAFNPPRSRSRLKSTAWTETPTFPRAGAVHRGRSCGYRTSVAIPYIIGLNRKLRQSRRDRPGGRKRSADARRVPHPPGRPARPRLGRAVGGDRSPAAADRTRWRRDRARAARAPSRPGPGDPARPDSARRAPGPCRSYQGGPRGNLPLEPAVAVGRRPARERSRARLHRGAWHPQPGAQSRFGAHRDDQTRRRRARRIWVGTLRVDRG